MSSVADGIKALYENWLVDDNGNYYDAGHYMPVMWLEGESRNFSELYDRGAVILHVNPLVSGTETQTFTLENGNYMEIEYTVYTHYDDVLHSEVFDRITWNINGYNQDGTSAGVGTAGSYSTGTLDFGQYLAWVSSGADLMFMNFDSYDGKGNPPHQLPMESYNLGYGVAFMPTAYLEGVLYPIGGTFNTALPEGCNIACAYSAFDSVVDSRDLPNETVSSTNFIDWITGSTSPKEGEDETTPGEDADAGEDNRPGGGGSIDYGREDAGIPSLPTISVANSGFCGVYHVSSPQLASLAQFMWSSSFFDNILKNYSSPADNIIMFGIVPWSNFNASSHEIYIGNLNTNINAPRLNTTFYELDCGSLKVGRPTGGTFADYEPYTKYWLFLPYIGIVDLPSDDVALNGQVNVVYHFDVFSGTCVAFVRCFTAAEGWFTLQEYSGNLLTTLPISGANYLQMYNQLASATIGTAASVMTENVGGVINGVMQASTAKPSYSRSGSVSNVAGLMGNQKPFLIRAVPNLARDSRYRLEQGYVSNLGGAISSHATSGTTNYFRGRVNYTNLSSISNATQEELEEIKSLISEGIYI